MINEGIIFGRISAEELIPDERELMARIGAPALTEEQLRVCRELLLRISPKYTAVKLPVEYLSEDTLKIGEIVIKSKNLIKNLGGSSEAYFLAVTLGAETDRYLARLGAVSEALRFVADGYSSALCEALCDFAEGEIFGDTPHCKRFSPGYGDLPLGIQGDILLALSAENLLGIRLTEKKMMIPRKSVTAIIGLKN